MLIASTGAFSGRQWEELLHSPQVRLFHTNALFAEQRLQVEFLQVQCYIIFDKDRFKHPLFLKWQAKVNYMNS
ncbi:unnamed protein product [Rhodiola kirilowii]